MKYGTRQSQGARRAARGERTEAKSVAPRNQTQLVDTRRQPRVSDTPDTPDLFSQVDAETWLAERLKQHGHDIYAGGPYETYADRLGVCIVRNGVACVIVGRGPNGRPESYRDFWERLYSRSLTDVPRDTPVGQSQQVIVKP